MPQTVPRARFVISRVGDSLSSSQTPSATIPPPIGKVDSDVPKIGGSSTGFIVLVVFLGAIVLFSCIGVFFLLRSHNPTPYEREQRRARRLHKQHTVSHEPQYGRGGLQGKIAKLFGRRKAEGWVRAGDGDDEEWDATDLRPELQKTDNLQARSITTSGPSVSHGTRLPEEGMSTESVELSAAAPSTYDDPFTSSPTSLERHETLDEREPSEEGRFSVQTGSDAASIRSMRKFESGTKFREALDF